MSVPIGRVVVTADTLNKIVRPVFLKNQSVINRIDFSLESGIVGFSARGRYLVPFKAEGTVEIVRFNFGRKGHSLALAVDLVLYPKVLSLFARNPLEILFSGRPGTRVNGGTLELELKEIPWLAALGEYRVAGAELFSLLEITEAGKSGEGLWFDLSVAEQELL